MSSERIHHLDWLKVLIVYGIVVYHACLVFAYVPWLIGNHERSLVLSAFAGFCFPWGIPAMFLIAGADAWFGLRSHSLADFARKRFLRLAVPLVPGLLILSPLQRFIVSRTPPPPLDQLPAYYVRFFRDLDLTWSPPVIGKYWLHLWFLAYLFAISLACAPLLKWLHGAAGRAVTARVAGAAQRLGVMPFALPMVLTQVVLRPFFPDYQDWADIAIYTTVFVWGAMVFSDRRFEGVIASHIRPIMVAALAASAGLGASLLLFPGTDIVSAEVRAVTWSLFVWCWLHAVLYLGIRWLDFPNPVITYLQEAVLPVYLIHHPYVLLVASFVVTWDAGVWPKFAVILVTVFAMTLLTYEFGIRRWNPMRLLFGLEPKGEVRRRGREAGSAIAGPATAAH
ncbi:MAG TPA: acyltransferase family protein [Candidatus Dormibacteraeota bacterium]|nr:acyltransferase family protein [Candidatus Dormibacteraeota bacterium]